MPKTDAAPAADPSLAAPAAAWEDAAREAQLKARRRRLSEMRTAWRRSLRRRGFAAFVAAMSLSVGGAVAHDPSPAPKKVVRAGHSGSVVFEIQRALGIPADGIFGRQTRRAVRRFQRRNGLLVDGIVGPVTLRALGISGSSVRRPATRRGRRGGGGSRARTLRAIARCESGGNPRAVSPDGRYRGKYQFSRATWRRLGGTGDPAKAPEAEQDRLAAKLLAAEGTSPWPACAARL